MIDLHCHILPGLDDGAATWQDALEMARKAAEGGTRILAATSHGNFSRGDPEDYLEQYRKTLVRFRQELAERNIPLKLAGGMELLVNEKLLRYGREHRLPSLNGGKYLLVEFWFDASSRRIREGPEELARMGWRLVLAHPERYDAIWRHPELLEELDRRGVVLQVNQGSLRGDFGRRARVLAEFMLRQEIAGAMASDAHDPILRSPDLDEISRLLELRYGPGAAAYLLRDNPGRILGSVDSL